MIQAKFDLNVRNHFRTGLPIIVFTILQVFSGIFASAFILFSSIKFELVEFNKLTISLSLIAIITSLFGGAYMASIKEIGSLIKSKSKEVIKSIYYKRLISYFSFAICTSGSLLLISKYGFESTGMLSKENYSQIFIICIFSILIGFNSALIQAQTKWIILGIIGILVSLPRLLILFFSPSEMLNADYVIKVLTIILVIVFFITYFMVIPLLKHSKISSAGSDIDERTKLDGTSNNYTGSIISNIIFMLLINFDIIIVNEIYGVNTGKIYAICAALTKIGYALILILMTLFLPYFIKYKSNLNKFKKLMFLSMLSVVTCSIIFNFVLLLYLDIFGESIYESDIINIRSLLIPTMTMIFLLSLLYAMEIAFLGAKRCFVFYLMTPAVSISVALIKYLNIPIDKAIFLISISLVLCLIFSVIKFFKLLGLKYANN